jgi:hypothetical protein
VRADSLSPPQNTQSHYLLRQTGQFDLNQALIRHARFPPPWSAEVQPNHYVVRDAKRKVATAGVCTVATDRPKATTSVGGKTANWNLINQAI